MGGRVALQGILDLASTFLFRAEECGSFLEHHLKLPGFGSLPCLWIARGPGGTLGPLHVLDHALPGICVKLDQDEIGPHEPFDRAVVGGLVDARCVEPKILQARSQWCEGRTC